MTARALVLAITMVGCWPYISGPYIGPDTDTDTDTDTDVDRGDLIEDIRTGAISPGTEVQIRDADVTGVWDRGYAIQDPFAGNENAGIVVFRGEPVDVQVGDRVDVSGVIEDYFGELQVITDVAATRVGEGLRVEPLDLSATSAADERYESMLVRVSGEVSDWSYDCTIDGAGCTDTRLWEIGGPGGVVVFDRMYEDTDWSSRVGDTPVVGVTTFRWQRRRLMPRTTEDFGS